MAFQKHNKSVALLTLKNNDRLLCFSSLLELITITLFQIFFFDSLQLTVLNTIKNTHLPFSLNLSEHLRTYDNISFTFVSVFGNKNHFSDLFCEQSTQNILIVAKLDRRFVHTYVASNLIKIVHFSTK